MFLDSCFLFVFILSLEFGSTNVTFFFYILNTGSNFYHKDCLLGFCFVFFQLP